MNDDDDDEDYDNHELVKNSIAYRLISAVFTTEEIARAEARARLEDQNSPRRYNDLNQPPDADDEWDVLELECCVCRDGSPAFEQRDELTNDESMQYQSHKIGLCAGQVTTFLFD